MDQMKIMTCLCIILCACAHDFDFMDHLPSDDVGDADALMATDAHDASIDADTTEDAVEEMDAADVSDEDTLDADVADGDAHDADGDIYDVMFDWIMPDMAMDAADAVVSDRVIDMDIRMDAGTDTIEISMDSGLDIGMDTIMDRGSDVQPDALPDLVRDLVSPEERMMDSGIDVGRSEDVMLPPDVFVMEVAQDAMPDVPPLDVRPDVAPDIFLDIVPDMVPPDVVPSVTGCADETAEQIYRADMVGCNGGEVQCDAVRLCGRGWHLCTMSEYATRGGETVRPLSARWIASCIRDNRGMPYCATNSVCPNCTSMGATRANSDWSCMGTRVDDTGSGNAGVLASPSVNTDAPHRLGCPASPCVWGVNGAVWSMNGAICCR